jgi:hypothetical protein
MHALLLLVFAVAAAAQTPAAAVPSADVIGSWDVSFSTAQGVIPGYIRLKKDGEKIVGTVGSQMGESPAEAEVKGKDVSIWFTFQSGNGPIDITMTGKVDGDRIAGGLSAGSQAIGDWTATRTKDTKDAKDPKDPKDAKDPATAKIDLTGAWNVSVELPNMTATPTITLKQDGEKLTGEYVSAQYGKFPITGTVKGADVNFSFTMGIEGSSLEVAYAATVDKDGGAMKGTVAYGEMMSGTFTATKKKT